MLNQKTVPSTQAFVEPKRKKSDGSSSTKEEPENDDSDDIDWANQWRGSWSSTIYSRESSDTTSLDDFNILKTLGVGSFGKVFLVQHKEKKDLYAMKSIRKDKVIEYDQLESAKLEWHILSTSNHPFIVAMEYVF